MFVMWTSITGNLTAKRASKIATEVWVYPAALIIIPSKAPFAFCIIVTISPSTLDCSNFISTWIDLECDSHFFLTVSRVSFPYF